MVGGLLRRQEVGLFYSERADGFAFSSFPVFSSTVFPEEMREI